MADNLVQNPGFAMVWAGDHAAYVFDVKTGTRTQVSLGNVFTPPRYKFCYRHGHDAALFAHDPNNTAGFVQPELTHMSAASFPERVMPGFTQSLKVMKTAGTYDFALAQQISGVPKGQWVRLEADVHCWSNNKDGLHPGEWNWSEGPGYGAGYITPPLTDGSPTPSGPGTVDDWRNFTLWCGIDPFGNLRPWDSAVVWGDGAHVYNQYHALPAVYAQSRSDAGVITVYVRAVERWRFWNGDCYIQELRCELVDEPVEPRSYRCTRVLIPQEVSDQEYAEIIAKYRLQRQTMTFSADDFAVRGPQIEWLRGIVEKPQRWPGGRDGLQAFFDTYYSGNLDELIFEGDEPPAPAPGDFLWQCDPAYGSVKIPNCTRTICQVGCFVTNVATAQRRLGLKADATPKTLIDDLGAAYFSQCNLAWRVAGFKEKTGLSIKAAWHGTDGAETRAWLAAGKRCAFAQIGLGSAEHWAYCEQYDAARADFRVFDPLRNTWRWLKDIVPNGPYGWRLIERYEQEPPPPPPPPPVVESINNVCFHFQQLREHDPYIRPRAAGGADPDYVKKVLGFEDCWTIWAMNPRTEVVVRHFTNDYGAVFGASTPERGAEIWWSYFGQSVEAIARRLQAERPGKRIWAESMNEVVATFATDELRQRVAIEVALYNLIQSKNLPIGLVCQCTAVGNPHETEYVEMLPLARIASANPDKLRFGYHAYWIPNGLEEHWKWLGGRWQEYNKVFAANGAPNVRYFCGEGGIVGGYYHATAHEFVEAVQDHEMRLMSLAAPEREEARRKVKFLPRFAPDYRPAARTRQMMARLMPTMGVTTAMLTEPDVMAALAGGYQLYPEDGWKSAHGYNGDINTYARDLARWNVLAGDVADLAVFTIGGFGHWPSFELNSGEIAVIQRTIFP